MTLLALLRHAPSTWNAAGKLQGRHDAALSAAGRATAARWRPPAELAGAVWVTSPLGRARETARLMGVRATVEPLLVEMDWGLWEGRTLAALRLAQPAEMAAREAQGLDFRPPRGESPRDVQERLLPFLAAVDARGGITAGVTHKGVIRAVLALATGWDMTGQAPARLVRDGIQLFRLDRTGRPRVERLNLPVAQVPAPAMPSPARATASEATR